MLSPDIPAPVLFHPLKHHLLYIRDFIREQDKGDEEALQAALKTLGSSQLDLYLGALSPKQLARETILYLDHLTSLNPQAYQLFLTAGGRDYQLITLSDGSKWVMRWGKLQGRHVHLHPARYSPHTWRVKANKLKTAVALSSYTLMHQQAAVTLELVNSIRSKWLELAPVKNFSLNDNLGKLLRLLSASETIP